MPFRSSRVLPLASPVPFQRHGPALASISPEVCLAGDSGVGGLSGLREHGRLVAHRRQPNARVGSCQQPPDLGFDLVIAPLADPSLDQVSLSVEEVFAGHASLSRARQIANSLSIAIG